MSRPCAPRTHGRLAARTTRPNYPAAVSERVEDIHARALATVEEWETFPFGVPLSAENDFRQRQSRWQ